MIPRMFLLIASALALCVALPSNSADAGEKESDASALPDPSKAFAVIDDWPGGRIYPAFYDYSVSPHAIVAKGRVFCAYQDSRGRPLVMAYDISEKQWSGPVRASDFGLGRDAHGNPSICIDSKGYLHLFFGCHGDPMRHVRSTQPYSIKEWEKAPSPAPVASYPQSMLMADGRIFLFYRAGGHMDPWVMRISEDDGMTWSEPRPIVHMLRDPDDPRAAAYCQFLPGVDGRTVHCFFVHKDDNPTRASPHHPWRPLRFGGLSEAVYRYNVYYIYRDENGVWRSGRGNKMDLPVSKAEADAEALVYDSGSEFTRLRQITLDEDNQPYLRFIEGVVDWTLADPKVVIPWRSMYATLGEDGWEVSDEVPADWPEPVKRRIQQHGANAYPIPSPWYIRDIRARLRPGAGCFIFLKHLKKGFATREGGPASPPPLGEEAEKVSG